MSLLRSHDLVRPREVARYYDNWTERYVESYGSILQASRPTSDDELLTYIADSTGMEKGMRVLDAGCGVCGPSIYFAQSKGVTIDAVTISRKQAEISRGEVAKNRLEANINVYEADFHNLSS